MYNVSILNNEIYYFQIQAPHISDLIGPLYEKHIREKLEVQKFGSIPNFDSNRTISNNNILKQSTIEVINSGCRECNGGAAMAWRSGIMGRQSKTNTARRLHGRVHRGVTSRSEIYIYLFTDPYAKIYTTMANAVSPFYAKSEPNIRLLDDYNIII